MTDDASESKRLTSYAESAYSEDAVNEAVARAGYDSFKRAVADLSTQGMTLTQIAQKLGLNPQRFWAYYQTWCRDHAEPLRLSED